MVSCRRVTLAAAALAVTVLGSQPSLAAPPDRAVAESARAEVVRGDLEAGLAAVKHDDWATARVYLQRAIDRDPQDPDALAAMGETWLRLGDRDKAFQYLEAALIVDPDHRGAIASMGELSLAVGNVAEARRQAGHLAQLCPRGCAERSRLEEAIAAKTGSHGGT